MQLKKRHCRDGRHKRASCWQPSFIAQLGEDGSVGSDEMFDRGNDLLLSALRWRCLPNSG
jgi:hypothetical protein